VRQEKIKSFKFETIDDKTDREVQTKIVKVMNEVPEKKCGSDLVEARTTDDPFGEGKTACAHTSCRVLAKQDYISRK
jgi:hypothetical protein